MTIIKNHSPRVSIGMAVFNGGTLLVFAIDSLLAQTFEDFELIITDNASTDETEERCRAYAQKDSRIVYIRRDKNYGANNNSHHALLQATGEYFMFAAHDDRWHPDFIASCVSVLDHNKTVVLAMPAVQFLTPEGTHCNIPYPVLHTIGTGIRNRVAGIFRENNVGYSAYGLYRREALGKIAIAIDCYGGDVVILLQLMLLGDAAFISQKLFYYRLSNKTAQQQINSVGSSEDTRHIDKPYTSLTVNLLRVITNAAINPSLKQVLISDVLQIITLQNPDWRIALLAENPACMNYIDPSRHGLNQQQVFNLSALFAACLLPYCPMGAPIERRIDFSGLEQFATIEPIDVQLPEPGEQQFIAQITRLIEQQKIAEAVTYFDAHRTRLPPTVAVMQIDPIVERCRKLAQR